MSLNIESSKGILSKKTGSTLEVIYPETQADLVGYKDINVEDALDTVFTKLEDPAGLEELIQKSLNEKFIVSSDDLVPGLSELDEGSFVFVYDELLNGDPNPEIEIIREIVREIVTEELAKIDLKEIINIAEIGTPGIVAPDGELTFVNPETGVLTFSSEAEVTVEDVQGMIDASIGNISSILQEIIGESI